MGDGRTGPWPAWIAPLSRVPEWGYGIAVAWRNGRFDRRVGVRSVGVPVISVGNIVAGGTGKSPMTRWVARWAIESGRHPLIAMRGYRSRAGISDEAEEHRRELPGVPLAVGPDRYEQVALVRAAHPLCDLVILDDGFQHRQLAREFDLVLVNGAAPALRSGLLPRGWLREPAANLRRAHAVVVTRVAAVNASIARAIEGVHGRVPLAWCDSEWEHLERFEPGEANGVAVVACNWLHGRRVGVWAGVAHGDEIVQATMSHGAQVVSAPSLGDHARYDPAMVQALSRAGRRDGAEAILVTGKDWSKLAPLVANLGLPILVPRLALRMHTGADELREALRIAIGQR